MSTAAALAKHIAAINGISVCFQLSVSLLLGSNNFIWLNPSYFLFFCMFAKTYLMSTTYNPSFIITIVLHLLSLGL
jgi:hypothetical protein